MVNRRRRSWTKMSLSPENTPPSPSAPHTSSRNTHRSSENVPPLPSENDTVPGTGASTAESRTPQRTDIPGNGNNSSNRGHQQYHSNLGTGVNFNSNSMPYYYGTHPSTRPPIFEGYQYPPDTHSYQFNQNNGQWHFQQAPAFNPSWYNQQYNINHGSNDSSSGNWVPLFLKYHYLNDTPYSQYNWTFPQPLSLLPNQYSQFYNDGWINDNQVGTIRPPPQFGSQASGWFTNSPRNVFAGPTEEMMRPFGSASQYYAPLPQEMMQPYAYDVLPSPPPPPPPPPCAHPPSPAIAHPPSPAIVSPPSPAIVSPPSPATPSASAVSPLCPSEDSLSKEQADKLSSQIRQQIEYYLSEQNFPTDDTLKSLLDENGWISIHEIAEIKKINKATNNIPFILEALQSSTSIEVQGNKIRRHIAQSTSHCQEVQESSSFNSSDADKNSRVTAVEDNFLEVKRDLDICLSASDNYTGEPSANKNKPSLEQLYIRQSLMVEPTNNSANQNSALDDCLNSESSRKDSSVNPAGNPSLKNPSNRNVCLDASTSQKYSNDGMNNHNFETVSFISCGRDDSEHISRSEDDDQLPNTRIDSVDHSSDQNIPSIFPQEIDGNKVGKYGLETLSRKDANLIDNAVMRFQQDELAMHSICQRPNTVAKLFNHDTSFCDDASGGKQKHKGNSKSDSSNNLHLFSSNFRSRSNSGNQQETGSESLIGRSCFFMGPTPPENNDSYNELLSGTSSPVAAIQKYSEFHKHCVGDWLSKGKGCSEEMFKLFRFWSYFLREHFIKSVYEKFKMLAIEDFSSNHDYGIQCLFRFFSSGLKKRFNGDIYKDFEKLTVDFYRKGYLYGVEKYREFHHCRIMDRPIKMHPFLEKLLNEENQNIDDFHYKIQSCDE